MIIRKEIPADIPAIHELLYTAFKGHPHHEPGAEPTEHKIVDQLRDKGELTLSLVAGQDNKIVGHIAFSPVMINGEDLNWLGLAPVAVAPEYQGQGIGAALINESLNQLQKQGVNGFVLLGSPGYYQRFGFTRHPELTYPGPPPEYFLALPCNNEVPTGKVSYSSAFS